MSKPPSQLRHGHRTGKESPTYTSWKSMLARCTRETHKNYPQYGGRGIEVAESWRVFENFLADMGERPAGKTLERKDSGGHYEHGNCRWATRAEQSMNRRANIRVIHEGKEILLAEVAHLVGVSSGAFWHRWKEHGLAKAVAMGPTRRRGEQAT